MTDELVDELFDASLVDPPGVKDASSVEQLVESLIEDDGFWHQLYRVLKPGGNVLVFAGARGWDLVSLGVRAAGFEFRDTIASVRPQSWEPIFLFRKPLDGTVVDNVLKHGTGALNIDATRVRTIDNLDGGAYSEGGRSSDLPGADRTEAAAGMFAEGGGRLPGQYQQPSGRWPPNLVLSHSPSGCRRVGTKKVRGSNPGNKPGSIKVAGFAYAQDEYTRTKMVHSLVGHADEDGLEEVEAWDCIETCPVAELDAQSGALTSGGKHVVCQVSAKGYRPNALGKESRQGEEPHPMYSDSGGASRFFPQFENPLTLMQWLVRLVCLKGGHLVLSGSELILRAATIEGMRCTRSNG